MKKSTNLGGQYCKVTPRWMELEDYKTRLNKMQQTTSFELPKQHKLAFPSSDCLRLLWIALSGIKYSCCLYKFSRCKSQATIHLNSWQVKSLSSVDADCATELYQDTTVRPKENHYFICFSPNN